MIGALGYWDANYMDTAADREIPIGTRHAADDLVAPVAEQLGVNRTVVTMADSSAGPVVV